MIDSLQDSTVLNLRKLALSRDIRKIKTTERGIVAVGTARKAELIAAIEAQEIENKKPKIQELSLDMFTLTDDERVVVEAALKISGLSLLELAKAGLLMKARRVTTDLAKVQELTPEQRRNTTLKGAAQANLRDTVDRIVAWNNACYDNKLRVFINASILRTLTGSNLNTIKEFLPTYRSADGETADQHNKRYRLTENDNRKGRDEFGHKIRISELIKQPLPATPKEVESIPQAKITEASKPTFPQETPEGFAEAIAQLQAESEILEACKVQMEALVVSNGSKGFSSFKNLVKPFRAAIAQLKLTPLNLYHHEYGSPRTLKDGEQKPQGASLDEAGRIVTEPRHLALKFLSPDQYKNRFSK